MDKNVRIGAVDMHQPTLDKQQEGLNEDLRILTELELNLPAGGDAVPQW